MTVNQTIRQTRKVIAYFRHSMVQKWGQGQIFEPIIRSKRQFDFSLLKCIC